MNLDTKINSNELNNESGYKINKKITLLLVLASTFFIQFFLIFGSLTENRFGTHLVFNGDLISSPLWFILSVFIISVLFLILYLFYIELNRRKIVSYTETSDKTFRIGSLFLIGFSIWFLALSSFGFAAKNSQFFESQLTDGLVYNGISISMQSLIIGIFAIIVLGLILFGTKIVAFFKKEFSNKSYKLLKVTSVALIVISFFQFNLSLIAFGTFGGDSGVLVTNLVGIEDPDAIYEIITSNASWTGIWILFGDQVVHLFRTIFGQDTIDGLEHVRTGLMGNAEGEEALKLIMKDLWNDGQSSFLSNGVEVTKTLSEPLKIWVADLVVGTKDGIYGVNNSMSAILLNWSMYLIIIGLILYYIVSTVFWKEENYNKSSSVMNVSLYTLVLLVILFGLLSWVSPYITGTFEYSTILPGLIAAPGHAGGIASAFVYFLPGYYGTTAWEVMFMILMLIPVITITFEIVVKIFFNSDESQEDEDVLVDEESKKVEQTKK